MKIDATVRKETLKIAVAVLAGSLLTEAVFLLAGKWDYYVLFGNLLGGIAAVCNFFLMGITLQSAVRTDAKRARNRIRLSQSLRLLFLAAVAAVGVTVPVFNAISTIVPLFFPRLTILIETPFVNRDKARALRIQPEGYAEETLNTEIKSSDGDRIDEDK